jgi:hypothetical protein
MISLTGTPENVNAPPVKALWARSPGLRLIGGLFGAVCLVVLFYGVENWRGRRAWEQCKRNLAAQGAWPDGAAHFAVAVPDEQNIFKAPGMSEWFLGRWPSDLTTRLGAARSSAQQNGAEDLVEVTIVSRTNQPAPPDSDLCLDYDEPLLKPAGLTQTETVSSNAFQVIPLIVMDAVPLRDAIKNLARQEGRQYVIDSNVVWGLTHSGPSLSRQPVQWFKSGLAGRSTVAEPCVSVRYQDVTAFQALTVILENYNLAWTEDLTTHVGRISLRTGTSSPVQLVPSAREQLKQALARASAPTGAGVQTLNAATGFLLYREDNPPSRPRHQPVRITVRSATIPTLREVEAFFPRDTMPGLPAAFNLQALPSGTNSFRLFANPAHSCRAEDYLAQTDPFKPDFDLMREALKRPYARIDRGDEGATSAPRNFVSIRVISQALAQRAQSYLLLGQPEHALDELTLIHDLSTVIEAEPRNLVSAMIEVAVTGLYISVIHDGLRLGAWREPQLLALQSQLEKIRLAPLMVEGLSAERGAICRTLETTSAEDFVNRLNPGGVPKTLGEQLNTPGFCVLAFAPRGWRYQSMVSVASLIQSSIVCFDSAKKTIRAGDLDRAASANQKLNESGSPTARLACAATPAFDRAWQVMAHNQSLADQAFIACALERYRLARGEYPIDVASLTPAFADRLPHDIIGGSALHYRRLDGDHFILYSIGWNEKDDGGLAPNDLSIAEYDKADWVWN